MRRREFIVSALCAGGLRAEPGEPRTFVYKKAGDCDIKADIFQTGGDERRPAAIWLHGGALIMGSRRLPAASRMLQTLLHSRFTVVSFDYRLAPETKLPGIIQDVQDAFRWLRSQAGMLNVDPDRIVVCGGSAGGYLTLMIGFCVQPAPKALVSYWGYGDILGEWTSRPDAFYVKQPLVSREEALASVGKTPISEADGATPRARFYYYCRQQGIWPKEVAGRDPDKEHSWFERYCPIHNLTSAYPPTLLVHGTADTDVPYQQSQIMAEALRRAGVEHTLISIEGGGHGLGNISPERRQPVYAEAAAFLTKHL